VAALSQPAVSSATGLMCVIGYPVRHSVSPPMQNAALRALGLDCVYVALEVAPDRVADAIRGASAMGYKGMNVTIPHKAAVAALVDELTPSARALASVNTVVFGEGGRTLGDSTDGSGFVASLEEEGIGVRGARVLVLGSGGSARSILWSLTLAGARTIAVAGRTPARVSVAADVARQAGPDVSVVEVAATPDELDANMEGCDLLVNTTPVGMHPRTESIPPMPRPSLLRGRVVCDIIFNPARTRFLEVAASAGARVVDGRGMLVHQGALSLAQWVGAQPDTSVMRRAVDEALA
jgi:shikimate dehydrogenase